MLIVHQPTAESEYVDLNKHGSSGLVDCSNLKWMHWKELWYWPLGHAAIFCWLAPSGSLVYLSPFSFAKVIKWYGKMNKNDLKVSLACYPFQPTLRLASISGSCCTLFSLLQVRLMNMYVANCWE